MMTEISAEPFRIGLMSFGFKYGPPTEAGVVFDVRFLPNPYWVDELRPYTGKDQPVADYVIGSSEGQGLLVVLVPLLRFVIEQNLRAGKPGLKIAIGCTGGHHRSVALVEALAPLLAMRGVAFDLCHRDLTREEMPRLNLG